VSLGLSARIDTLLDLRQVGRCVLVLLPIFLWAEVSGDPLWLRAAIMAVAAFIGLERVGLAPLWVLLQGLATVAGFILLTFAWQVPLLFVLACALMAAAAIGLSAYGRKLRSLGNFIFIPALYLACETAEGQVWPGLMVNALHFIPYMLLCLLPVLLLSLFEHAERLRHTGGRWLPHYLQLRRQLELGDRLAVCEAMIAVALAVALAAALIEYQHLGHGQWVVWSAASVVTGDVASTHAKLRDRARGAVFGVPCGIALGWLLPHNQLAFALMAVTSILTLVAFRRYVQGFATRCACVAATLMVADQSLAVVSERVINVLLGGVIGVVLVVVLHWLAAGRGQWLRTDGTVSQDGEPPSPG
jgi:hypothetical protein